MRVIAGVAKGKLLKAPPGGAVRPATSRMREAVFSIIGETVVGARVLDLYAGTGALGIEALSRGAQHCDFVEPEHKHVAVIEHNLKTTDLGRFATVHPMKAEQFVRRGVPSAFDLVFVDPPYSMGFPSSVLSGLADGDGLASGAVLIVETQARQGPFDVPSGFELTVSRRYADSAVSFLVYEGDNK